MVRLRTEKLHATVLADEFQQLPRRYTLTHSDRTGDLYLTIAQEYDMKQISGLYTRFMHDEVLSEWQTSEEGPTLHVYCYVGGGFVFGSVKMREAIFRREMPLVLEAIRNGDTLFFEKNPDFDNAPIKVHYQKSGKDYKVERFGSPSDYAFKKNKFLNARACDQRFALSVG